MEERVLFIVTGGILIVLCLLCTCYLLFYDTLLSDCLFVKWITDLKRKHYIKQISTRSLTFE